MTPVPHRSHTDDLLSFIRASPSPYHAVASAAQRLEKAGFRELRGTDDWTGTTGGSFVVRGGALIAWYAPEGTPCHTPFRIIGTHTDSPNLRIKPTPDTGSAGWRQIAVEIYGGVPLNTWLDRDLGISGRLALRGPGGTTESRLVQIDEPLLRVPQLAIHLDRSVNDGLALDRQRHIAPVWSLGAAEEGALLRRVAAAAEADPDEVLGWDLMLHDIQPPDTWARRRSSWSRPGWTTWCRCTRVSRRWPARPGRPESPRTSPSWPPSITRRSAAVPTPVRRARCWSAC